MSKSPGEKIKIKIKIFGVFTAAFLAAFGVFIFPAQAAPDATIYYQGKLTDKVTDVAVPDLSYDFKFRIFDAASSGACVWSAQGTCGSPTSKSVTVSKGIFSTALGEAGDNALNLDFNSNYWLEVTVGTDTPMTPLKKINAAGYAINSLKLEGKTWEVPGTIGSSTPNTAAFTTLSSSGITQLATTAGSTLSMGNSTGAATLASGGTSSWTNTAGGLTVSTASSGTLALTSAGALNLSAAAASTWTLASAVDSLNLDSNTLSVDALNDRIGIGTTAPGYKLSIDGGSGSTSGLSIANLGTATYGIDLSSSGLTTSDYLFYFNSGNYWQAGGTLDAGSLVISQYGRIGTSNGLSSIASGILGLNTDYMLSVGSGGGNMHNGYSGSYILVNPSFTEYSSGNHQLISGLGIRPVTMTGDSATISDTATVFIEGASTATVSGQNYSLWIDDGSSRFDGNVGIGTIAPTAKLHIAAGTTAAGGAPLKLTTGTALATPEDGAIEYDTSHLWFTISSTRYQLDQQGGHTQNTDTGTSGTTFTIGDSSTTFIIDTSTTDDSITIEQGTYDSTMTFTQNVSAPQTYTFSAGGVVTTLGNSTTGSGSNIVLSTAPTFVTSITSPIVIGGTGVTDDLILRTTSGNAVSGADMIFQTGNGGLTEAMRILYDGKIGIGTTAPNVKLEVVSTSEQLRLSYSDSFYTKFTVGNDSKLTLETNSGTQSMIKVGKGEAQDAGVSFDGNTNDYYIGMDDTTDELLIGLGLGVGTTPYITVESNGEVGIGTQNPAYDLDVGGGTSGYDIRGYDVYTHDGGVTSFSDIRLKTITGEYQRGLDEIMNLNPIYFKYSENNPLGLDGKEEVVGLVAQELQKVIPEAVKEGQNGYLTITNAPLLYAAINAIKDQQLNFENQAEFLQKINEINNSLIEKSITAEEALEKLGEQGLALENKVNEIDAKVSDQEERITILESQFNIGTQEQNLESLTNNTTENQSVALDISAMNFEGLDIVKKDLSDAQAAIKINSGKIEGLDKDMSQVKTDILAFQNPSIQEETENSNEDVLGPEIISGQEGLAIESPVEFKGKSIFRTFAEFFGKVIFNDKVEFAQDAEFKKELKIGGRIIFDKDSAGYAVVSKNENNIKIEFEKEYSEAPLVNANVSLQQIKDQELREATEDLLLSSDIKYIITDVTTKGFEIKISNAYEWEIPFTWQAVAVKDPKTFGKKEDISIEDIGSILSQENMNSSILEITTQGSGEETNLEEEISNSDEESGSEIMGEETELTTQIQAEDNSVN